MVKVSKIDIKLESGLEPIPKIESDRLGNGEDLAIKEIEVKAEEVDEATQWEVSADIDSVCGRRNRIFSLGKVRCVSEFI